MLKIKRTLEQHATTTPSLARVNFIRIADEIPMVVEIYGREIMFSPGKVGSSQNDIINGVALTIRAYLLAKIEPLNFGIIKAARDICAGFEAELPVEVKLSEAVPLALERAKTLAHHSELPEYAWDDKVSSIIFRGDIEYRSSQGLIKVDGKLFGMALMCHALNEVGIDHPNALYGELLRHTIQSAIANSCSGILPDLAGG